MDATEGPDQARGVDGSDEVVARKRALRTATRQARRALDVDERRHASATIAARLLALKDLTRAGTLAVFAATDEEPDVAAALPAFRARGVRLLLPRVVGDDLELCAFTTDDDLAPGFRGLLEPTGPAVAVGEVDAVVLPAVALDPHGNRLGRGGGHYDRLLARLDPATLTVGVCFSCQVVPAVPRLAHDRPVDVVITDRSVHVRPVGVDDAPA